MKWQHDLIINRTGPLSTKTYSLFTLVVFVYFSDHSDNSFAIPFSCFCKLFVSVRYVCIQNGEMSNNSSRGNFLSISFNFWILYSVLCNKIRLIHQTYSFRLFIPHGKLLYFKYQKSWDDKNMIVTVKAVYFNPFR